MGGLPPSHARKEGTFLQPLELNLRKRELSMRQQCHAVDTETSGASLFPAISELLHGSEGKQFLVGCELAILAHRVQTSDDKFTS